MMMRRDVGDGSDHGNGRRSVERRGALRVAAWMLLGIALVAPAGVRAQSDRPAPREAFDSSSGLCWRGRALPTCRTFVLTEIGYYAVGAVTQRHFQYTYPTGTGDSVTYRYAEDAMSPQLTAELGMMQNTGPRTALGATIVLGFGTGGADVGLKGRYRRWLSPSGMALDLGAGVMSGTLQQANGDVRSPGLTMDAALNVADYGALVVRTDIQRSRGQTAHALFGGVRLGSRPAAAGSVLLVAGFFALVALFSGIAVD